MVNTVKNLRELMETGAEPLVLMSQLTTMITNILAGSYDSMKGSRRRRFFKQSALTKDDMENLRQALKTLSEAEKQLRMSNDKLTWLTVALLQLAPDRQYMWPSSSADTISFNHSPLFLNDKAGREVARKSNVGHTMTSYGRGLDSINERLRIASSDAHDADRGHRRSSFGKDRAKMDEIWLDVLDKIWITSIKEFLYQEGKSISVSYNAAPTMQ